MHKTLDPKASAVLLKVRKGATAGFNAKRWQEALTTLGYIVEFRGKGRNNRRIIVTAENGETVESDCCGFYDLTRWLAGRGLKGAASEALGLPTIEAEKIEKENKARDWANTGTCGICGMNVKMHNGQLVLHGYRRPGCGEAVGSCYSVNWPPYEVDYNVCLAHKLNCKDALKRTEANLVKISKEGFTGDYWIAATRHRAGGVVKKGDHQWGEMWKADKIAVARRVEELKADIARMAKLITDWKPGMKMPEQIARERGWLK